MRELRIGIIDSGVTGPVRKLVSVSRSFTGDASTHDRLGHGSRICEIVANGVADAKLAVARVFADRPIARPDAVAEAVDWLAEAGAGLINMSFGVAADREVLAQACRRALDRGVILVASAPARGRPCFPAAYPKVISVTGDARCHRGEHSVLDGLAQFGTWCASPERDPAATISGASIAAAHFTALSARWLIANPGAGCTELVSHMRASASHVGPERRVDPDPV